jgi:beta-galactosidase
MTDAGGWIVLNNVTPASLADFDKLVGVDHIMRPFGREKVTWPKVRNPLAAGLSGNNITMGNGQQIFNFQAGEWPDENAYSYVVDLDDIAPFGKSPYFGWGNAVNNFTSADGAWQLIQDLPPEQAVMPITLPRPEKLLELTWVSDTNYEGTTKIRLTVNGRDYTFDTQPNGEPQIFSIPGQPTASELTIKIVDWTHDPAKAHNGKDIVGIDNISLKVARPADFGEKVKPFLNIGAIVVYPMGKGGVVLCNIKFLDSEKNPVNTGKKLNILSALLQNLHAPFSKKSDGFVAPLPPAGQKTI